MRTFWWNKVPNLGDLLTSMLVPEATWAPADLAEFIGIGSMLEWFDGAEVTVWGSGRAGPRAPRTDLSRANVLALRGLMTQALVTGKAEVYGDPGLLVPDIQPKRYPTAYTAIVPHWQDQDRMRETYPTAEFVDVMGDPGLALAQIAGADMLISSSFHGIVLADAYAIPRMWDWFDGTQAKGFKFRDYGTVVGKFEPGMWHQPDPALVSGIRTELRECLSSHLARV